MKNLLILICTCSSLSLFGVDPKFPVSSIPEDLKQNANVVYRHHEAVFKIYSRSRATYYVHQVITILNEKGKSFASEVVYYDKLRKVKDINGFVYNSQGEVVKKLKNNTIYDQSAFDGMYGDARLKSLDLSYSTYPYTVDIEYEVEYKFLYSIPTFALLHGQSTSVEKAVYALHFSPDVTPRYKCSDSMTKPVEGQSSEGLKTLTWQFSNVKPSKREPYSGDDAEPLTILAAPSAFEYDGYVGTMTTWDDYGKWIASLNKGRGELPPSTKEKIKALTASAKTKEEKIKVLYEYLQGKTRYVSIQLGIGGLQPFEASVVDQTGYGDCKALSNYMMSMLETAGIKSYYTLVDSEAGDGNLIADFPSHQFDHVLVAVPMERDTIWLECTSQSTPMGYQGWHTGDRKALMITETGAKIVKTTQYTADMNLQTRTAQVTLLANGDANADVKTSYAGLQFENGYLDNVLYTGTDDQKKWVQENTDIPNFDIQGFAFSGVKSRVPSATVNTQLLLRRFASISGKRVFITPNLMNRFTSIPEKVENRKTKVVQRVPYTDLDTIRYILPEGIYPEFLPEAVNVKSRFGEYEAKFQVDQGSLLYTRRLKVFKGEFPPESYQEMIDFYKSVNKADHVKIVFLSKT
jgi:transglutaminase-like putative cysteine protease